MRAVALLRRELIGFGPAMNDRPAALRMALSVAAPVLALLFAGRPELIVYAVFGSFTGMYGKVETHQLRLIHQTQAAFLLVAGATIGAGVAAISIPPWSLVPTEAVLAAAGSLIADRMRLKPAGPFFAIFAFGACAAVPPTVPWWCAALITVASAVFSILIGFSGWFRARHWVRGASRPSTQVARRLVIAHALRYFLAVGVAGSVGLLLGIGHAYWAMAAAAVPLAADTLQDRIRRGIHRIIGTFAGLGTTALVLLPHPPTAVLATAVIALQFPTELFSSRHYGLSLVFFTPLVLTVTFLANPSNPSQLIADRAFETALGAAVGIAVAVFIREPRGRLAGTHDAGPPPK